MSDITGLGSIGGASIAALQSMINMNWQNAWSGAQAKKQQAYNAMMQVQNQQWMQAMSNTAYQRATADMKAAGLNPMLAYQQGGASAPSTGALSASIPQGSHIDVAANTARGAQAGAAVGQAIVQSDNIKANTQLAQATTARQVADTQQSEAQTRNIDAQTAINLLGPSRVQQEIATSAAQAGAHGAAANRDNASAGLTNLTRDQQAASGRQGLGPASWMDAGRAALAQAWRTGTNLGTAIGPSSAAGAARAYVGARDAITGGGAAAAAARSTLERAWDLIRGRSTPLRNRD